MLTAREAFKVGFLGRLVEEGLDAGQIHARVKLAESLLEKRALLSQLLGGAIDVGKGVAGGLAGYGIPLALALPPIAGGLAGAGAAKLTDLDDTDVDEVKDQEVTDEYHRQAARLRRQKAVRDFMRTRRPAGRALL